jgi:undecaprenyl-diphosphatase
VDEIVRAIFLGAVQGLTEFLPVSSSGHLKLVQEGLGWTAEFGLAFDTLLHVATLLAVLIYFREDFKNLILAAFSSDPARAHDKRLAWLIVVATIPTGIIGLIGNDWFENVSMLMVGFAFLITAGSLAAAEYFSAKSMHDAEGLGWGQAVLVGIAQGVAIMPGISRSGATMSAGLGLGLDREQAARFSFLLAAPIILLAGMKQMLDVAMGDATLPGVAASIAGFIAAGATGYLAIWGLLAFVRKHSFYPFAIYTAVLGIVVIVWQLTL